MAAQITLVRGASTLDLALGTDDIYLAENGWIRTVARRNRDGTWPDDVPETLLTRIDADDHDDLATIIQGVNDFMRQAGDYAIEEVDDNPVYLRAQLTDETNPYQALVMGGLMEPDASFFGCPVDEWSYLPESVLEITRKPFWEPVSSASITCTGLDSAGDMFDYSGSAPSGDVPGRLSAVRFDEQTGGDMSTMAEHWLGLRTARFGVIANFEPVWQLEDAGAGYLFNNTTDEGTYLRWTPGGGADDLMLTRAIISAGDVSANPEDQRGRFLVLIRAKNSSVAGTRTFRIKIASGLLDGSSWDERPRVLVDSNNYYFYPVGEFSFPVTGRTTGISEQGMMDKQAFRIQAEIADEGDSTGNLDMERLVLIPIAEGFMHIKSTETITIVGDGAYFFTEPDDSNASLVYTEPDNRFPRGLPTWDEANWKLPPEAGAIVYAGQDTNESRTTDTLRVVLTYFERWLTLGGAG